MEPTPDCRPMMAYLYSAPLVYFDDSGEPNAVPELEYQTEQQRVLEALKEMRLSIRWRSYVATTHNFLAAVSMCQIVHFTGHGENGNVMFEDEHGKALLKTNQQLHDLFSGAVRSHLSFRMHKTPHATLCWQPRYVLVYSHRSLS